MIPLLRADQIDVILFDVDGTLFDRDRAQRETCRALTETFGNLFAHIDPGIIMDAFLESDTEATRRYDAGGGVEVSRIGRISHFLSLLGIDTEYAYEMNRVYIKRYPLANVPIDGAGDTVARLARRFRLGVVSNGIPDVQYQKLITLGLDRFMQCTVLSEELGIRKPDARIFERALADLQTDAAQSLYVGDSYSRDIVGAKKAGMGAIWFNPGHDSVPENDTKPDHIVHTLAEIPDLLGINNE